MKRLLLLGVVLSLMLLALPQAQAAESVYILVEFNTATDESFTATVYGGSGCVSAASATPCGDSIAFNSTDGRTAWDNAERIGGSAQDGTHPILIITNTGNVALDLQMRTSLAIEAVDSCLLMRYVAEQEASCSTAVAGTSALPLNATAVQIDASFAMADNQWCVWLFGNFTNCGTGIDQTYLYINTTTV